MRSEIWDRVEKKLRCRVAISRAEGLDLARRYVLDKVVNTYIELGDDEKRRYAAEVANHKEIREMAVTWEEALAEREAKGAQDAIWLLMKHRFRPEAADLTRLREELHAISNLDRLHRILERASTADRIEDVDLG